MLFSNTFFIANDNEFLALEVAIGLHPIQLILKRKRIELLGLTVNSMYVCILSILLLQNSKSISRQLH